MPGFCKVPMKVVNVDGQSELVVSGLVRSMARSLLSRVASRAGSSHSSLSPKEVLTRRTLRRKRRLIERSRHMASCFLWESLSLRRAERLEASRSRSRVQTGRNRPGRRREFATHGRRVETANRRAAASSCRGLAAKARAAEASGIVRSTILVTRAHKC